MWLIFNKIPGRYCNSTRYGVQSGWYFIKFLVATSTAAANTMTICTHVKFVMN